MKFGLLFLMHLLPLAAWAQARSGDRYFDRTQYQDAADAYQKALDGSDNPSREHYNIGNARYRQGKYADAQTHYQKALEGQAAPEQKADAWHNLGNCRFQQQDYRGAVEAYQNSLRLRPGNADTRDNLMLAKRQLKQQQQQQQQQENRQSGEDDQPQPPSGPGDQPPNQPPSAQARNQDEARRFLETAVEPEDQRNTRRYREGDRQQKKQPAQKDW
ncbi:MAG: tetratricopeptide repeat protein [Saprospiraceae bacterium]|nr:tetratricopeptide repeat protein [Saprospiraceae bacterium]